MQTDENETVASVKSVTNVAGCYVLEFNGPFITENMSRMFALLTISKKKITNKVSKVRELKKMTSCSKKIKQGSMKRWIGFQSLL